MTNINANFTQLKAFLKQEVELGNVSSMHDLRRMVLDNRLMNAITNDEAIELLGLKPYLVKHIADVKKPETITEFKKAKKRLDRILNFYRDRIILYTKRVIMAKADDQQMYYRDALRNLNNIALEHEEELTYVKNQLHHLHYLQHMKDSNNKGNKS